MANSDTMPIKHNVICFGYLPWSQMWKRNQSMMAQIARFSFVNEVIFVNPVTSLRHQATDIRRPHEVMLKPITGLMPEKAQANIRVYSPFRFLPFKRHIAMLEKIENHLFLWMIRRINQGRPYALFINDPIKSPAFVIDSLLKKARLSIFDFSDDFVEYFKVEDQHNRETCQTNVSRYAGSADIVLAVNSHLQRKYRTVNPRIEVLKNATNYHNFDRERFLPVEALEEVKARNQPLIGYIGGIRKNRFDFNLLEHVLHHKPKWQFVFIGSADLAFKNRFANQANVHLLPAVKYTRLPDYLNYFDLAFVPFKENEHTRGNDLLKIYDFLAMGKPVVSTDVGEIGALKDIIRITGTPEEFVAAMERSLESEPAAAVEQRKSAARKNSWPVRITALEHMVKMGLS